MKYIKDLSEIGKKQYEVLHLDLEICGRKKQEEKRTKINQLKKCKWQ